MKKDTIRIPKNEYKKLKKKADLSDDLLAELVKGLEDIRHGRIKPWK
ncbi:hypothetical protein HYT58_00760 [Candidatus Woesearchaeota archaeon]|nr:hypothetical protein [Candidatus Woesearchaeota archaeon]